MSDSRERPRRPRRATARNDGDGARAETPRGLAADLRAGVHDEALLRLASAPDAADVLEPMADATSPIWDDPRYVAWWLERARERLQQRVADAGVVSDGTGLTAGRELMARVACKQVHVARWGGPPEWVAPSARGAPARVLDHAAAEGATPVVDLAVAAGEGRALWDEEAAEWVRLPTGAPPGRYLALRVAGDSMEPALHTGDTVLVRLGTQLRADTVVVARLPDAQCADGGGCDGYDGYEGYVVKRVAAVRPDRVELASLAQGRAALTLPRDDRLVVGTVVLAWCPHGTSLDVER